MTKLKKLRFRSKHVFLTYPKCELPLEHVLDLLNTQLRTIHITILKYIISHEVHQDGDSHRHCWLELSTAPECVDQKLFDLDGHHGNYQSMRYEDNCAKYVLKDGNYITNLSEEAIKNKIATANRPSYKINKDVIAKRLMNGESLLNVVQDNPALLWDLGKLRDNLMLYKQLSSTAEPLKELKNEWIWGGTGTGKSLDVATRFPDAHRKPKEIFWDSYEFEDVVVMEDVDETWEDVLWELKIWADHYVYQGRIKHKPSLKMRPKQIIVTSNYTIEELMMRIFKRKGITCDPILIKAIERRFTQIRKDSFEPVSNVFPVDYFLENKENIPDKYDWFNRDFNVEL